MAATYGCMFMAVPHRGSESADWASIIAGIAKLGASLSTVALEQLQRDSKDLQTLSTRFGNLVESLMFVSVMEAESTKLNSNIPRGSVLVSVTQACDPDGDVSD